MRRLIVVLFLLMPMSAQADFRSSLIKLDPQTRLEQVCDLEAMHKIAKDGKFKPDRAKSYVSHAPKLSGHTLTAKGAAFRSGGLWYELAFTCKGSADHMNVEQFNYRIGRIIPQSKWDALGLWR